MSAPSLPAVGVDLLEAADCGCVGVEHSTQGRYTYLRVTVPCAAGHPDHVAAGVVIPVRTDDVRPYREGLW